MELTVWTYEAPPHVGAMRIANSMPGLHYVLHAPQGDTYADLLFTMIERNDHRPPVTYTTFQARDLGGDTAGLFKTALRDADDRFNPEAIIVGSSCTAELIQDDPGGLALSEGVKAPVFPLELPAYQKKENWGASETFYQLVRGLANRDRAEKQSNRQCDRPTCNILGPSSLGFRARDNVKEIKSLLEDLGVTVNLVAPLGCSPRRLQTITEADFNVVLYPEIAAVSAKWLEREFNMPYTKTNPIGVGATLDFIQEIAGLTGLDPKPLIARNKSRLPWYSRSIDSTYLTGKRVFIFGDGSHAAAMARVARDEMGFDVVGLGTYSREQARTVRSVAADMGLEALITDDYLAVEDAIAAAAPELVLGSQMERHIAKRLGIGCAVISAPIHVQDFPARYAPTMGFEGANVLFDTLIHPLVMGLEEHLLGMFREDFEFHDGAGASHLAHSAPARSDPSPAGEKIPSNLSENNTQTDNPAEILLKSGAGLNSLDQSILTQSASPVPLNIDDLIWEPGAVTELKKIPFFVRGKVKRNTEAYAVQTGLKAITLETLYDAKAHYGR